MAQIIIDGYSLNTTVNMATEIFLAAELVASLGEPKALTVEHDGGRIAFLLKPATTIALFLDRTTDAGSIYESYAPNLDTFARDRKRLETDADEI